MVEDKGIKLGRSTAQIVADAGNVRSDVRENMDRRGATKQTLQPLSGGKAGSGDVGLAGHDAAARHDVSKGLLANPSATKGVQTQTAEVTPRPEISRMPSLPAAPSTTGDAAVGRQHAENLDRTRQDAKGLQVLLQGGKAAQQVSNKLPPVQQTTTPNDAAMRSALIASFTPGPKSTAQPKLPETPAKTTMPRTQESATEKAVLAKAKSEEQSGAKLGKDAEVNIATQVAQRAPSPFAAQPQSDARRVDDQEKDIESDKAAEGGLKLLAGGEGAKGVARAKYTNHEFSKGSYNIAFIEEDDLAAIEGKAGPVPGRAVAIDGSSAREVTVLLHFTNKILNTKDDRPPVGVLIARTADDTPLSSRVLGSAKDHKQMAEGGRGSAYGLGKIFG